MVNKQSPAVATQAVSTNNNSAPTLSEVTVAAHTHTSQSISTVGVASKNANPSGSGSALVDRRDIPKITYQQFDLPKFSGQPEQWPIFISAFASRRKHLDTPLQNEFRLQKFLKRAAFEAVKNIMINPNKVDAIIT